MPDFDYTQLGYGNMVPRLIPEVDVMRGFRTNPVTGQSMSGSNPTGALPTNFDANSLNYGGMGGATGNSAFQPSWMQEMLGYTDDKGMKFGGWGGLALGAAQGVMNGWLGMQQLDLAKDALSFNKEQFNKNYAAQRQTTNTALEDRQRARVASNAGAYESVGSYMNNNGIK